MRFSGRLPPDVAPTPFAALVADLRARLPGVLDLAETNPTRCALPYPADAVRDALGDPAVLSYEPDPRGRVATRRAIAADWPVRDVPVDPEDVVLTASTSEAYGWLFKVLCDPGDAVLVPRPSYPLFDILADLESVRAVPYPLRYDGRWHVDVAAVGEAAAREGARAVVVVNPNNPTGSYLKRHEHAALADLCTRMGMALVSDEVFAPYPSGPDADRVETVAGRSPCLAFALGGLSKSVGLPQVKLGWIAVSGPSEAKGEALARLDLVADTFLSVGTPAQLAAPRLLAEGQVTRDAIRTRVAANRAVVEAAVTEAPGCRLLHAEGGWTAIVRIPAVAPEETLVLDLLERDGVLVQPGFFYDLAPGAHVVLSLLPAPEVFAPGALRLARRLAAWTAGHASPDGAPA